MASATDLQNPNLGESDHPQQQVMSSPNATAVTSMSGDPVIRRPRSQDLAAGTLDMDGETVAPTGRPAGVTQAPMPEAEQSTPLVLNGTTARRVPGDAARSNTRYPEDAEHLEGTDRTDEGGRDRPIGSNGWFAKGSTSSRKCSSIVRNETFDISDESGRSRICVGEVVGESRTTPAVSERTARDTIVF